MWERRCRQSGEERGFQTLRWSLTPDVTLQQFVSSAYNERGMHAQKEYNRTLAVAIFWAARAGWVKQHRRLSVISGVLACRTMFSLKALGRTVPSLLHRQRQPWTSRPLAAAVPSPSHSHMISSSVSTEVSTDRSFLVKTSRPGLNPR